MNNHHQQPQFAPESSQVIAEKDDLWKKYKVWLISSAIIPIIIGSWMIWLWQTQMQMEEQASELYRKASTSENWKSVIQKYPQSSFAADALLNLAADSREQQQYDQAISYYREFLKFRQHPVIPAVELAIASCLDISGKTAEAREAYFKITQNTQHPFFAPASIALARIYKQQGNIPNARQTLNDLIAQSRQSQFLSEARFLLAQLPEQTLSK